MRILIADDDVIALAVLRKTLELEGYDVESCTDGRDAFDILMNTDEPKIAILDWMMGGMNGLEVIRQVKTSTNPMSPYLILLTARSQSHEIVEGLDVGADDYVIKPFNRIELLARVQAGRRVLDLQEKLHLRVVELELAKEEIRDLSGLITICSHCRRIRDDDGTWVDLEEYIRRHSDARFSHGICRDCRLEEYPDLFRENTGE